jgi:hypothetical protein
VATLYTVVKGILSVREEEVVVRISGDKGGNKGVPGVAARIFDLEEDVYLLMSISGKPSTVTAQSLQQSPRGAGGSHRASSSSTIRAR